MLSSCKCLDIGVLHKILFILTLKVVLDLDCQSVSFLALIVDLRGHFDNF